MRGMASEPARIVLIGAGSASFGRGTIADIMACEDLRGQGCTLVLVDRDEAALARMARLAEMIRAHYGAPVRLEATTDLSAALPGAGFVIISVAIHRMELWEQDFRVPLAHGFRHCLGENGGPGALFHALRNFELVIPICREVERLCPDALVLNFTNPESRIVMAMDRLTSVRAVGLCHGVMGARRRAAELLGRPEDDLEMVTGGLNHFFWMLKVADARTGEDLYPAFRERVRETGPPLVRKMLEVFGCFTYPSDDHIGEYLAFAHEFTGLRWHYGLECRQVPRERQAEATDWREEYLSGGRQADDRLVHPGGELAADIIADILCDRKRWEPAVNVPNTGRFVENLPEEAVVEVPAVVDASGVHPVSVGPLPEALAAYSRTQVSIQRLLVEAYRERSRNLLLQALLLDPVVDSVERAEAMLDTMLELQADYLPEFG